MRVFTWFVLLLPALASAAPKKSNQVRPTPSPIGNPALGEGDWVVSPEVVYARYTDNLETGIPGFPIHYAINSLGLLVEGQYGLLSWLHLGVTLEGYRKFGTITGPSPGDPSQVVEAHALGWAFKGGLQANVRVYRLGKADTEDNPEMFDFSAYIFAKAMVDIFNQDQVEPLSTTTFSETAFLYRAGAALHVYVGGGFFVAPFAGIEGLAWGGAREDTIGGTTTRQDIAGSDPIYPFVGGDILWAPAIFGTSYDQAFSLAAIVALATEDDGGFGGNLLTLSLGYTFEF